MELRSDATLIHLLLFAAVELLAVAVSAAAADRTRDRHRQGRQMARPSRARSRLAAPNTPSTPAVTSTTDDKGRFSDDRFAPASGRSWWKRRASCRSTGRRPSAPVTVAVLALAMLQRDPGPNAGRVRQVDWRRRERRRRRCERRVAMTTRSPRISRSRRRTRG